MLIIIKICKRSLVKKTQICVILAVCTSRYFALLAFQSLRKESDLKRHMTHLHTQDDFYETSHSFLNIVIRHDPG